MIRISGWPNFFFRFPSLFFPCICILTLHFYHCRYFKNDFMTLETIYFFEYAHTLTLFFFYKNCDRLSENLPALYTTLTTGRKRFGFNIGRTGFTLFRRFQRFRRAELPDEYNMQCTPPIYLLRHKCLRKDQFICCSSLE